MFCIRKYIAVVVVLCLAHSMAWGQELRVNTAEPRIALVLGGGGARGAAHIGVLEIIEREHIALTCVVGTSMGALVAGSYAAGMTPEEMRRQLSAADWGDMFLDGADYGQLSYRKKRISQRYLSGVELGVTSKGVEFHSGVIAGTKIKLFFNQLVKADYGVRKIEDLPLPVAIVATDIGTGEEVVFRSGSLSHAMRASMSVPGFMAPLDYQGRKLVDGGLVDNLPVAVARDLCQPTHIIAVNVGSPLRPANEIGSLISVTGQMIGVLTDQNVTRSIASLKPEDIYLYPDLGDIGAVDFQRSEDAIAAGRKVALSELPRLQALASPVALPERARAIAANDLPLFIDAVEVAPLQHVHPDYVQRQIRQRSGQYLDRAQLEQDLIRIYGDGFYESVDYQIEQREQRNILMVEAKENNWSSDYLSFGFNLDAEYQRGSEFNLRTAYRNTWLNSLGGEFFAAINIGGKTSLELNFYQPLNSRQDYFVEPAYVSRREDLPIYLGSEKIAEYQLNTAYADWMLGRNLGIYGQAKVGWREYRIRADQEISEVLLPGINEQYGGFYAGVVVDNRNRLFFPSRGWYGELSYFDSREMDYQKINGDINYAYAVDDFVLAGRVNYVTSLASDLPVYDYVRLGGFLHLSAYARNQILADEVFYTHLRAERIMGRMPLGLSGDIRLGIGIEAAHMGVNYNQLEEGDWLDSGVIYLGGETPVGPVYIGYGFNLKGDFNLYFQLGAY